MDFAFVFRSTFALSATASDTSQQCWLFRLLCSFASSLILIAGSIIHNHFVTGSMYNCFVFLLNSLVIFM